jgi:uncharacterized membrane protein YoaK (UPF0700 family)
MSLLHARAYAVLFALGAVCGVAFSSLYASGALSGKSLTASGSASMASADDSRCTQSSSSAEEVYFVSCGGLF